MQYTGISALKKSQLIAGKVAVVTGAAAGIGASIAKVFAGQGAKVAIVDLNYDQAMKVAEEILSSGGEAFAVKADITKDADIDRIFEETWNKSERLDVVVNNAGGGLSTGFFDLQLEEWKRIIDINLTATFRISQKAAPFLIKNSGGSIINVSSLAGRSCSPTAGCHYTASKAGVLGLTRHMARELAKYNIRVNSVCPGVVNTERIATRVKAQNTMQAICDAIPLGRLGEAEEVAGGCLFLASDLSSYMTGATLDINGGSLMI